MKTLERTRMQQFLGFDQKELRIKDLLLHSLSLRKASNNAMYQSKRMIPQEATSPVDWKKIEEVALQVASLGEDEAMVCTQLQVIRSALTKSTDPNFSTIVQKLSEIGAYDAILSLMGSRNATIAYESSWCACNILSATSIQSYAKHAVESGIIERIKSLLKCKEAQLGEIALWVIGNLSSEKEYILLLLSDEELVESLLTKMNNYKTLDLKINRLLSWTILNFSRSNIYTQVFQPFLVYLTNALKDINDYNTTIDCLSAISHITDSTTLDLSQFASNEFITLLSKIIGEGKPALSVVAIRIIGNLSFDTTNVDKMFECCNLFSVIYNWMNNFIETEPLYCKEGLWVLSNIIDSEERLGMVVDKPIIGLVISIVKFSNYYQIQREGKWVLCNCYSSANLYQILQLTKLGCLELIFNHYQEERNDENLMVLILDSIKNILSKISSNQTDVLVIAKTKIKSFLDYLLMSSNAKLSLFAQQLLKIHFATDIE